MLSKFYTILLSILLLTGCKGLVDKGEGQDAFSSEKANYRLELSMDGAKSLSTEQWTEQYEIIKQRALLSENVVSNVELEAANSRIYVDLVSFDDLTIRDFLTVQGKLEFREAYSPRSLPALKSSLEKIKANEFFYDNFDILETPNQAQLGYCLADKCEALQNEIGSAIGDQLPHFLQFIWGKNPTKGVRARNQNNWYQLYAINYDSSIESLSNSQITKVTATNNPITGEPAIDVFFNESGSKILGSTTERLRNKAGSSLAIIFDNKVLGAFVVNTSINAGRLQVGGNLSKADVKTMASILQLPALIGKMKIRSETSI